MIISKKFKTTSVVYKNLGKLNFTKILNANISGSKLGVFKRIRNI